MPVSHRRSLVLGALSLAVASVASVAAMYRAEPTVGLRTGGSTESQEMYLEPGTAPTTTGAPEAVTTTMPPVVTTPDRPATKPGEWPEWIDTPEERGCIPGTYNPSDGGCETYPTHLEGTVRDTAGRPLGGICMYWMGIAPEMLVARTDAQGRYRTDQSGTADTTWLFTACPDTRPSSGG